MPGINQLPAGAEYAAAISLTWASCSWLCSGLLLWLTWAHHEGWSYLALLAISSLISTTCSVVQQSRDITWYHDIITEQFLRQQKLPADDPELAIAGGSFGIDLVLYYLQYYNYNVQAMLVMFWAAELCQLTYQVGERRKIRQIFRKLHAAGKFVSWLLPMATILCLRIPSLKYNFVGFLLIADLPLMISLAIGSCLMIAVTVRYVQSRQKFTQWSPPKFNSATSGSEAGTSASGTQNSSRRLNNSGQRGLYDRWLMVRFTIAFVLLAIFEVTNTLFQVTALENDLHDAQAPAPDLSVGRAVQTLFLFMPGTTPGIFLYIVFGTTAASRRKVAQAFLPKRWSERLSNGSRTCLPCFGRKRRVPPTTGSLAGITVERSLTITSANRVRASRKFDEDDFSDPSDISMSDIPRRPESAMSISRMKPLPIAPPMPSSKFRSLASSATGRSPPEITSAPRAFGGLNVIGEKHSIDDRSLSTMASDDSLRSPDDYHRMGPDHSDDSGPILPIQRPEVRFSMDILKAGRGSAASDRQSKNFSRLRR